MLANDGDPVGAQCNDATAHHAGAGRAENDVRERRKCLPIESIDDRHATVVPGVANEPDARPIAANGGGRGIDGRAGKLSLESARGRYGARGDPALCEPPGQIDLLQICLVVVQSATGDRRDGKECTISVDAHEPALVRRPDVGLADETGDALASGHGDDLHPLRRGRAALSRSTVAYVDVVVAGNDHAPCCPVVRDTVAECLERLASAQRSGDDQGQDDHKNRSVSESVATRSWHCPALVRREGNPLEVAPNQVAKIRRHVTLRGACAAEPGSGWRQRCRAGHRARRRSPVA